MSVVELKDASFKDSISSDKPILVDFFSNTCPPCRAQAPILDSMAAKYSDKITFAKLNIESNQKFLVEYDVMSIPTLIVFQNGSPIKRLVGLHDEATLTSILSNDNLI